MNLEESSTPVDNIPKRLCKKCDTWKELHLMVPKRHSCKSCRNRYTEQVRDKDLHRRLNAGYMRERRAREKTMVTKAICT